MRAFAAAILMTLTAVAAMGTDLGCEPEFVRQSRTLLAEARYGLSESEHAAFIVRERDGSMKFDEWPFRPEWRQARFTGIVPATAIAIIHTHPNSRPVPSADDAETARHAGMPVYVVTRTMIARTDGTTTQIVRSGDWKADGASCGR